MKLRPHQTKAIDMVRHSMMKGNKRVILAAPCSFGKSITAAAILKSAAEKGKRGIFICDRVKLIKQALDLFDNLGLHVGVIQGQHYRSNPYAPIQLASIQTLSRRSKLPEFDIAIVDECFPAGTLISTSTGDIPIELVRPSMKVHNAIGVGEVVSSTAKTTSEIVEIVLNDGSRIRCTGNHKVFTDSGWVEARHLEVSSRVFSKKELSSMWSDDVAGCHRGCNAGKGCRIPVEEYKNLLQILLEEVGESYAQQVIKGKDEKYIEAYRSQAEDSWRKWSRSNRSAGSTVECSAFGMGCGACNTYEDKTLEQRPNTEPLQGRFSEQRTHDCNRAGWRKSLLNKETEAGCKKRLCSCVLRVESVEVKKLGSDEVVYNIGVSGHPSYFANNVLVHNCHTHYDSLTNMMEAYNAVPFIGLSATPYSKGLGKYYSDLIVPITTRQLLDQGFLCPIEYYGGRRVNTKGVKKKGIPTGGTDYDPKALASAVEADAKLVGDIVKNWLTYGEDRQTIAFSPSIKHSQELVEMFNNSGIPAVHIDGYMDDEEREEIFKAHDHGEFKILSCSRLLNTGYDAPSVSCLIDCFPTSSKIVIQQRYGRVQRIFEGKDKAIILDHAGNVHEHGYIEDFVPEALDDGDKQFTERNQLKEKEEPKTNDCPQCYKIFMGLRCACGYEIVVKARLESDDQVLQKINGKIYTKDDKARWLAELKLYARAKGFKDGWANHKFKEKFKEWPKVKIEQAFSISQEVKGFIQHSNIKRAKGAAA